MNKENKSKKFEDSPLILLLILAELLLIFATLAIYF